MRKVAIIGSGGAGKSTLARKLGEILDIPVYHLDAIFWRPNWEPIERDELIEKTMEIQETDDWIIDGNYNTTMDFRLQQADTVIFLHFFVVFMESSRDAYNIIIKLVLIWEKTVRKGLIGSFSTGYVRIIKRKPHLSMSVFQN